MPFVGKILTAITFSFILLCLLVTCDSRISNQEKEPGGTVTTSYESQDSVSKVDDGDVEQYLAVHVIYYSADGGNTWTVFDNKIPQDAIVSAFVTIDDKILASTDNHGIYSIKEGEKEWRRIDEDLPQNIDINAIVRIGNHLIIGTFGHGILISKNSGKNWTSASVQIAKTQVRCLHVKDNFVLAGTDNGIYKSVDRGNTWMYIYQGVQVNGFTELHNTIYAALMNGAIMSNDKGLSWKYVYKPNTLHDISNDGERLYAMTLGAGLKISNNGGQSWENANNGLGTLNLYTFEVKNFRDKVFAAQWYGIYILNNSANNWTIIKSGLPDSTAFITLETTRNGLIAGVGLRKK